MFYALFLIVLCLSVMPTMAQEDDLDLDVSSSEGYETPSLIDGNGHYRPSATSPTAMRKCGATLEQIRAKGFTVAVTLSKPVTARNMQYCYYDKKRKRFVEGRTDRLGPSYGHRPIVLPTTYVVWTNPNRPGVAVADGCLNEFEGDIPVPDKPIERPRPKQPKCTNIDLTHAQARLAGLDIATDGSCIRPTAPPPPPPPPAEDCPEGDCPEDVKLESFASGKSKALGGKLGLLVSGVGGGIISGVANESVEAGITDGLISAGANRTANYAKPNHDKVLATCAGQNREFKKGKGGKVGDCELRWSGNTAVLLSNGKQCLALQLAENMHITIITLPRQKKSSKATAPIKTQGGSDGRTPERPVGQAGEGNRIPGAGVPPLTRPRRDTFTDSNGMTQVRRP